MATVTIGTFNAENLFARLRFKQIDQITADQARSMLERGILFDTKKFEIILDVERELTGKALHGIRADVVGLQEVENLDTLRLFNNRHLPSGGRFWQTLVVDGNDRRLIDVGVASKRPVDLVRTHQFRRSGNSRVFSRDCLEVHIRVGSKSLPLFVNHLKSMIGGREQTRARREVQCRELIAILTERFGPNFGDADWALVGDLNDYIEPGLEHQSALRLLTETGQMVNVVDRLPAGERWTHFYNGDKTYHQLDYIFLSRALAARNPAALPVIERRGQPLRVNQPGQPVRVAQFFPEVQGDLKASDHCPVAITVEL